MIQAKLTTRRSSETFVSAWPSELISTLPAVQYDIGTQRHWRRIAHVYIPNVQPGQVLQCKACFEATNGLPFIVELAACLVLTPTLTGVAGLDQLMSVSGSEHPNEGKFITRCAGYNLTPNACPKFPNGGMHHGIFPLAKDYIVPSGIVGDHYVAIMAYCGGLNYWPTSDVITIEPWCSDLSVTRIF